MNDHDDYLDTWNLMHMAISRPQHEQRLLDEMMRVKHKEYERAFHDALVNGTGVVGAQAPQVSYSMAEIQLMDGSSQTFMIKASTNIVNHLIKEMRDKGYLTMWNDTDVLTIRADQVKQFTLRAFTQQEK